MRTRVLILLGAIALLAGCQYDQYGESPMTDLSAGFEVELESIVSDSGPETKTYADDDHLVVWHNDDRISVFEKNAYPKEYKYSGGTGTVGGRLLPVSSEDSGTGEDLDYYYAVYPHSESNGFDAEGHMLLTIPKEQPYDELSFGRGTNLMVSAAKDLAFRFKNIGGYLVFKLYGEGVSVSSIRLTGKNGEKLTGNIDVVMSPGAEPVVTMSTASDAEVFDEAIVVCDPPVALGATAEDFKEFWFVLPPMTLENYMIEVTTSDGSVWTKSSTKAKTITRNHYTPISPMEITAESLVPPGNIVFADPEVKRICVENWDTDQDGELSYREAAAVTSLGNQFSYNSIITTFNELQYFTGITSVGGYNNSNFISCENLVSICLPNSLKEIRAYAFAHCYSLTSLYIPASVDYVYPIPYDQLNGFIWGCTGLESIVISPDNKKYDSRNGCNAIIETASNLLLAGCNTSTIPDSVTSIASEAFSYCTRLTSISIPSSVTSIGNGAFSGCVGLTSIDVDPANSVYDSRDNCNAIIETGTNTLFLGCPMTVIPDSVTNIGRSAFYGCIDLASISIPSSVVNIGEYAFFRCHGLVSINIPDSVTSIGNGAFSSCNSLTSIVVNATTPPTGGSGMFNYTNNCPIYVPAGSVEAYKSAQYWSDYADRIQAIAPVPVTSVSLDTDFLSLPIGSSRTLTPLVLPENAADKTVTWSSSDVSVATVSSTGVVTGIKEGRATISAQSGDIVATCSVEVFEAIREDFNPNTYLLYRENPTTRSNGENYYRTVSYMPEVSGSKVEMKFQLTGPGPITSGNTCRDYYRYIDIAQSSLEWNEVERDDGDYYDDLETFPIPSATSLLLIKFDGVDRTMSINGRVFSCSRDSMSLPHLFASYGHESDEGIWESYDGVPDGSKLYYVKVWDADDTLKCLCYATTSVNPETNMTEYCWCSYYPKTDTSTYTFANDAVHQGGFEGVTYGE